MLVSFLMDPENRRGWRWQRTASQSSSSYISMTPAWGLDDWVLLQLNSHSLYFNSESKCLLLFPHNLMTDHSPSFKPVLYWRNKRRAWASSACCDLLRLIYWCTQIFRVCLSPRSQIWFLVANWRNKKTVGNPQQNSKSQICIRLWVSLSHTLCVCVWVGGWVCGEQEEKGSKEECDVQEHEEKA
jgi:hypothetical protein